MNYTRFEGPTNRNELRQDIANYIDLVKTVADVIHNAGELPSGTLYAMLMGCMDLRSYNNVIGILKRTGLVQERSFLLTWTGPRFEEKPKEYAAPIVPTIRRISKNKSDE